MSHHRNDAEKSLQDQTNLLPRGQLLVVFAALATPLIISFIDQNSIGVALPTIAKDLHAENTITWAGTSSLIANTMFSVLYGRLSDIFGRKAVHMSVLILLSFADLLCGLSRNGPMFYAFRGLAGLAGGGVSSLTMIIVSDIVTLEQRGKYQGILGSCIGIGNSIGPFIFAAFVQRSTWRSLFFLISPLAAASCLSTWFLLPSTMPKGSSKKNLNKIDFFGVITSSVAIIFLLIPISGGGSYFTWDSPMIISMLVIGGCCVPLFVFVEWKVATLPMLPTSFFRNPVISALFIQSFFLGAGYQSYLYYLPLYFQNARQWSTIKSATLILPLVALQSIASVVSGQYTSRFKRYGEVIWVGFALWTIGSGLAVSFTRSTSPGVIAVILGVVGTGIGFTFQPTLVALQAHCTLSKRAVVISDRNFFRSLGGACGLAVSAAVLQATLKANLPQGYKYLAYTTYALPKQSTIAVADWERLLDAYMAASHAVFILQVPLIGICLLCCLVLRDRGLERPEEPEENSNEKEGPGLTSVADLESSAMTDGEKLAEKTSGPKAAESNRNVELSGSALEASSSEVFRKKETL